MKRMLLGFLSAVFSVAPSFAAIQCPNSTSFVNAGDTIQQVIQRCGPPQKTVDVQSQAAIWTYTLMQFGNADRVGFTIWFDGNAVSKMATTQGLEKTAITCPKGTIKVGSKPSQVVAACGQPSNIQNVSSQLQQKTGKIIHLIYQPQSYLPETVFIFKNGALIGTE